MINKLYTGKDIELLIEKFNNRSLEKSDWTHEAHLIVAIWYINTFEFFEAVCRLKSGIIVLNNAHLTENTSKGGYHETLTIFWAKVISTYMRIKGPRSIDFFVNNFLHSPLANKNLPYEFYDKEKLFTTNLRTIYLEEYKGRIDELTIRKILTEI
jgi:hypothetical protein